MKLTADDYKRHYREISDEEFLAIDRDDLVDIARRCYDAELARRQLAPATAPEPEPLEPGPSSRVAGPVPDEDWVRVAVFTFPDEAKSAEGLLASADIPTYIQNEKTLGVNWNLTNALGGLRLMVPASCAEAARDLLAGPLTETNKALAQQWLQNEWTPDNLDLTDFSVTIDDLFGEGEKVAVRMTIEGVNPKTGRDVKIGGLAIVRVVDGVIAEHWIKLDS